MLAAAEAPQVVETAQPAHQHPPPAPGEARGPAHPGDHHAGREAVERARQARPGKQIERTPEAELDRSEPLAREPAGARGVAADDRQHRLAGPRQCRAQPLEEQLRPARRSAGHDLCHSHHPRL